MKKNVDNLDHNIILQKSHGLGAAQGRISDIKHDIFFSTALIVMFNLLPGILQIQIIMLEKILGTESGYLLIIGVPK